MKWTCLNEQFTDEEQNMVRQVIENSLQKVFVSHHTITYFFSIHTIIPTSHRQLKIICEMLITAFFSY